MTTLQHIRYFSGATRAMYAELAEISPPVAVFGHQVNVQLDFGIRGVDLEADDPLCREWALVVLGPGSCAALIARELDQPGLEAEAGGDERRFDMAITFDQARVTLAARKLLDRVL